MRRLINTKLFKLLEQPENESETGDLHFRLAYDEFVNRISDICTSRENSMANLFTLAYTRLELKTQLSVLSTQRAKKNAPIVDWLNKSLSMLFSGLRLPFLQWLVGVLGRLVGLALIIDCGLRLTLGGRFEVLPAFRRLFRLDSPYLIEMLTAMAHLAFALVDPYPRIVLLPLLVGRLDLLRSRSICRLLLLLGSGLHYLDKHRLFVA